MSLDTSYKKIESTRLNGNIKKKQTVISTNCKNDLLEFSTDLQILQIST